eukprot:243850_1
MSSVDRLEKGLKLYYDTFNLKYNKQFTEYIEDNGFDDGDVIKEMEEASAEECIMVDFDETFPLYPKIENDKKRGLEIYRIIKHCYDKGEPPPTMPMPLKRDKKIPHFQW